MLFRSSTYLLCNIEERIRLFRWEIFNVTADWEIAPFIDLGAITKEMIAQSTGLLVVDDVQSDIRVSGSLESHYSPSAHVLLDTQPQTGEGFIAMDSIETPPGTIRLAAPSSIEGFAREIYSALRYADAQGLTKVCVIQPEGDGLAAAIRDRLKRAAN